MTSAEIAVGLESCEDTCEGVGNLDALRLSHDQRW